MAGADRRHPEHHVAAIGIVDRRQRHVAGSGGLIASKDREAFGEAEAWSVNAVGEHAPGRDDDFGMIAEQPLAGGKEVVGRQKVVVEEDDDISVFGRVKDGVALGARSGPAGDGASRGWKGGERRGVDIIRLCRADEQAVGQRRLPGQVGNGLGQQIATTGGGDADHDLQSRFRSGVSHVCHHNEPRSRSSTPK